MPIMGRPMARGTTKVPRLRTSVRCIKMKQVARQTLAFGDDFYRNYEDQHHHQDGEVGKAKALRTTIHSSSRMDGTFSCALRIFKPLAQCSADQAKKFSQVKTAAPVKMACPKFCLRLRKHAEHLVPKYGTVAPGIELEQQAIQEAHRHASFAAHRWAARRVSSSIRATSCRSMRRP